MVDKTVMRYLKKRIDTKMDKELSSKQPPFGELVADVARTMALRSPYLLLPTPYSLLPTPYSLLPTPYSLLPTPYVHPQVHSVVLARDVVAWSGLEEVWVGARFGGCTVREKSRK